MSTGFRDQIDVLKGLQLYSDSAIEHRKGAVQWLSANDTMRSRTALEKLRHALEGNPHLIQIVESILNQIK
jgi:ubiquinone biosynthesis protein UbiJ